MEKDFQRWTAKRKVELLLQLIRGETKLVDARHLTHAVAATGRCPSPCPT